MAVCLEASSNCNFRLSVHPYQMYSAGCERGPTGPQPVWVKRDYYWLDNINIWVFILDNVNNNNHKRTVTSRSPAEKVEALSFLFCISFHAFILKDTSSVWQQLWFRGSCFTNYPISQDLSSKDLVLGNVSRYPAVFTAWLALPYPGA